MKKKVEIGDFAMIKKLGNLTLSPTGKKAAFTVTEGSIEENRYKTDIWVYDEERTPSLFRLTTGEDGSAPVFESEDVILFSADRKGAHPSDVTGAKTTYSRISLRGGEAEEAFFLPFKSSAPTKLSENLWLMGGRRKIDLPDFDAMSEEEKKEAVKVLEEEKDYEVFDELPYVMNGQGVINKKRTGLFLCDTASGTQELLSDLYLDLGGYTVNEKKDSVLYWGTRYETVNRQKSVMFLYDLQDQTQKELPLQNRYSVSDAVFIGEEVLFIASDGKKMGTSENEAVYLIKADGSFSELSRPDLSFGAAGSDVAGGGSSFRGTDGFYYTAIRNYHSDYEVMRKDGTIEILASEIPMISAGAGVRDDLFFIGMEKDGAQELYRKKNGNVTKLTGFNKDYFETHETAATEHFSFTDTDGVEIDGWVLYPSDYDPSKKYPGILNVHGGPRSIYSEGFFHEMQYWAAEGYISFFCNPRGSSGKGDDFADILGENFGVRDYHDIMEFTDEVLRRVPAIDPERLGMTGGSYGGFMANWIIGHTDRFKAVASCRSISNYISKCLTTDIGYYHNLSQIGFDPWTAPEKMWEHSPLAYADRAVTPTLFIQSDEDYRCYMADAFQMYQALLMHDVPARLCLFHGENHELSRSGKPKHRVRRIREITAWFDRYLKA